MHNPRHDAPGVHDGPSSGTAQQPAEIPSRPASPFIPPAPSDELMPLSQRPIYPQGYTPFGYNVRLPNRQMNPASYPTRIAHDNNPYVAIDPFMPSIMQNHRKNSVRHENDSPYVAVDPFMPSIMQNHRENFVRDNDRIFGAESNNYQQHHSYPYHSPNSYPVHHASAQPPRSTYQPAAMAINPYHPPAHNVQPGSDVVWGSALPRPVVDSERLSSRSRGRSRERSRGRSRSRTRSNIRSRVRSRSRSRTRSRIRSRTRSRSRSRSRSRIRRRSRCKTLSRTHSRTDGGTRNWTYGGESKQAPYRPSANHDAIVIQPVIRTPSVLSQAGAEEPVVTSNQESTRLPPSKETIDTETKAHHYYEILTHDPVATKKLIVTVLFDLIPRQLYLHFLLRLPYLYFSRVTRIFEETELSMAEIRKQTLENKGNLFGYFPGDKIGLVRTWESFIDSLLREWKTLNIVSVLLLSAILTILQIDVAASDPIIRYSALLSMICALMSLLYGCMYIIRFGSMKKAHKAAVWAEEAQSTKTNIFWNVWVLLAMPATWLAWSIILYITCIAAFIWRTSPGEDPGTLSISNPLWPRIVLSAILGLGLVYFVLIIATLRRYGDAMDQAWRMRVENWAQSWPYPGQNDNPYNYSPYNVPGILQDFGTMSMPPMPPVKIPSSLESPNNWGRNSNDRGNVRNNDPDPWGLVLGDRDRQTNSQGNPVIPGVRPKSRSSRGSSPSTLPPVIVQIPNSPGEIEHSHPDIKKDRPSDGAGDTAPNTNNPSLSNLPDRAVKPEAPSRSEEVNSSDTDREAAEIYEITYSGKTRIDTLLWKNRSELGQAVAFKVCDLNSNLEEGLVNEEQYRKLPGTSVSRAKFDNLAKGLRNYTTYSSGEMKPVGETDLKEILDLLKTFNDEVCSSLDFRLALCNEEPGSNISVYFVPTNIVTAALQDTPT